MQLSTNSPSPFQRRRNNYTPTPLRQCAYPPTILNPYLNSKVRLCDCASTPWPPTPFNTTQGGGKAKSPKILETMTRGEKSASQTVHWEGVIYNLGSTNILKYLYWGQYIYFKIFVLGSTNILKYLYWAVQNFRAVQISHDTGNWRAISRQETFINKM